MFVLDTDHISILQHAGSAACEGLLEKLSTADVEIATSAITLEEQFRSWLAMINRTADARRQVSHYARFVGTHEFFRGWVVLPFDDDAANQFIQLRQQRLRVSTSDLKIAAICLVNDATLLTRNLHDFERVPGLGVENWL